MPIARSHREHDQAERARQKSTLFWGSYDSAPNNGPVGLIAFGALVVVVVVLLLALLLRALA